MDFNNINGSFTKAKILAAPLEDCPEVTPVLSAVCFSFERWTADINRSFLFKIPLIHLSLNSDQALLELVSSPNNIIDPDWSSSKTLGSFINHRWILVAL